jgi:hypothetical protein
MDRRVKPGGDEWIDMRHRPYCLEGAGCAFGLSPSFAPSEIEGARDAGVPVTGRACHPRLPDPQAPTPRGTGAMAALLQNNAAQRCEVRRLPGVPRAVFFGLLRATPGGLTFQTPSLSGRAPIHRWWDKSSCRGMAPLV